MKPCRVDNKKFDILGLTAIKSRTFKARSMSLEFLVLTFCSTIFQKVTQSC